MSVIAELIRGAPLPLTVHLKEGDSVTTALDTGGFVAACEVADERIHGTAGIIILDFIEPPQKKTAAPPSTETARGDA